MFDRVREISHGIHPAILSERGLQPALKALGRRSAVPVELDLRAGRRLPGPVEVAAYYAVSEALANAAKHAQASVVHVELDTPGTIVRLAVRDDGIGGADPARGSGTGGAQRPHRGARRHAPRHQPRRRRHHAAHRDPSRRPGQPRGARTIAAAAFPAVRRSLTIRWRLGRRDRQAKGL